MENAVPAPLAGIVPAQYRPYISARLIFEIWISPALTRNVIDNINSLPSFPSLRHHFPTGSQSRETLYRCHLWYMAARMKKSRLPNTERTEAHTLALICKFVNNKYRNYGGSISFSRHANSERHLGEREITYGFCRDDGLFRTCATGVRRETLAGRPTACLSRTQTGHPQNSEWFVGRGNGTFATHPRPSALGKCNLQINSGGAMIYVWKLDKLIFPAWVSNICIKPWIGLQMFINCVCHNSVKSAIRGERVGGGCTSGAARGGAGRPEECTRHLLTHYVHARTRISCATPRFV